MERCRLLGPPPRDAFPEVYLVPSLGGRVLLTELTKHDLTASSRKGYLSSEEEHSGPARSAPGCSCPIYSRSIIMFHSTLATSPRDMYPQGSEDAPLSESPASSPLDCAIRAFSPWSTLKEPQVAA